MSTRRASIGTMRMVLFCYDNYMNFNQPTFGAENKGYGNASVILGLIPIIFYPFLMFFPFVGIVLGALAIVLGIKSKNTTSKKAGIAGIVLGSISEAYLLFMIVSAFIYM